MLRCPACGLVPPPDPDPPIPQPSTSVQVSPAVQRQVEDLPKNFLTRGRSAVSLRAADFHGTRLRYGHRKPAAVAPIAEVWLDPEGHIRETSCSICPHMHPFAGWPHGCVHTLGLVLRAIEGTLSAGEAPEQHPLLDQTSAAIRRKLGRQDGLDLLSLAAHDLCRRYDDRTFPRVGTVADVLDPDTRPPVWSALQLETLAESVSLELQARRLARTKAPWRDTRPEDDFQADFFDSVHAELDRRRAHAHPLLAPGAKHGGKLSIETRPLRVLWVSNDRRCTTLGHRLRYVLSYDAGGVRIHTERGPVVDDRCPYAIDLLHVLLDYLCGRYTKAGKGRLVEALKFPPWQQDVDQLDQILDDLGVSPTPLDIEPTPEGNGKGKQLGWQVCRQNNRQWTIRAVWTSPYVRRTGLKVEDVQFSDLEDRTRRFSRHDRAILQEVESVWRLRQCTDPAVFRAAAGHPRMVDDHRELFTYRIGTLGLSLSPDDNGALRIAFTDTTTGRIWSHAEVGELLKDRGQGQVCFDRATIPPTLLVLSKASARLTAALQAREPVLPAPARSALLARIPALRSVLPIRLHPDLIGSARDADVRPVLRLVPLAEGPIEVQVRIRPLPGGPLVPPGEGPDELESVVGEARVFTTRDLDEERDTVRDALGEDADLIAATGDVRLPLHDHTLARLHRLQARAEAGELLLEWTGDALRVGRNAQTRDIQISVGGSRDWLALGGALQVGAHTIELQRVIEAVRSGRRFVRVDAGNWVGLSDQLRDRMARLATRIRTDKRGRSTVAPMSGEVLQGLASDGAEVDVPDALHVEADRIREARATTFPAPSGLTATLRPYQAEGLTWLQRLAHWAPGACLADDMGLGKTIQALGLLLHRASDGPALVVAPTSLASNWMAEATRFAPSLTFQSYRGPRRAELLEPMGPHSVLVTSYDIMRRDAKKLVSAGFHTVIYDEAQALKNASSQTARAAATLRGSFCLALSGTPVENRSEELWSLFRVLVPGLLGSKDWFRSELAQPADDGDDTARARLSSLVAPFLLRRTKQQVAKELPERTEVIRRIALSRSERRLYDAARLAGLQIREEDPQKARFAVLKALTRLRQLSCDPRLVDPKSKVQSSKLAALQELVDGIVHQGAQVLVFSQWTSLLDRVETTLQAHRCIRLDGSTAQKKRGQLVENFQKGAADVFLISRKAGGTGLNLTAATYVIHLDPWWNPAAEDQATDRAHRIGQSRTVTVYRLIAEGTVEEGVLEMQAAKRELVDSILEGTRSRQTPSIDELLALLRGS